MKIVLMHYHLKPGGVTTVLKQQATAISKSGEVLVITGEPPDSSFAFDTAYIPGLGYDGEGRDKIDRPRQVARAVEDAIFSKWKTGCDVLHVHNPILKKNRNFLKILKLLQILGQNLFLQIHDFAEDGRPRAYFNDEYPANCHYGVINRRDEEILLRAGLKKKGLHRIFNTIHFFDLEDQSPQEEPLILYPIRAIRRKNIGEALLLSLFFKDREALHITLPPNSPADIKPYRKWKDFVKRTALKVLFDAGLSADFPNLVRLAKFMNTTSITEGFGFCFLEPWTAHKLLWGRKLPDICRDFETNGIRLDHLYENLWVPLAWLGKENVYEKWVTAIMTSSRLIGLHPGKETISNAFEQVTKGQMIDFGLLDETFQEKIVTRILCQKKDKQTLIRLNPYLAHPGMISNQKPVIEKNHQAITKAYNPQMYQEKLTKIYARVATEPVHHCIDKQVVLNCFFDLRSFSLLKWGPNAV